MKVRLSSQSAGSRTRFKKRSGSRSIRKGKSWTRTAVSDIIANLLILAITVTLFSTIIWFVSSMPAPQPNSYGDFSSNVNYRAGEYVNITIKHMGGEPLDNSHTNIFIMTNSGQVNANITDSRPSIGAFWNLGATWTYNTTNPIVTNLNANSKLEVMIINTERNMVVWSGKLLDNTASSTPAILDRYLASYVGANIWVKDSSFYDKEQVALFVNVYDGGGDMPINGVVADTSQLGGPKALILSDTNRDGWFSAPFQIINSAAGTFQIKINATDLGGKSTETALNVRLYTNTDQNGGGPGGAGNGSAPGDLYFSNLQGINLYKYQDFMKYNYSAIPTSSFKMSDNQMVVLVASKMLLNTINLNEISILDQKGNIIKAVSTPNAQFSAYDYFSGFYVYTAIIDITGTGMIDNANYFAQVQLRDSRLPENDQFFATVPFKIGTPTAPVIETYSDSSYTTKKTNFTTTDTIYVKITQAPVGTWNQSAGVVEITDYASDTQIKRIPGSTSTLENPVSTLTRNPGDATVYTFTINLSAANQYPWIPGGNAYMLRYDAFQVGANGFLLGKMVNITAPKVILDLVSGINSVKGGWANGALIEYYPNNNQWVPPDFIQSWDGKHLTTYDAAKYVRLANINDNGKLDIVAVVLSSGEEVINIYRNDGSWTPVLVDSSSHGRGTITAIALGVMDITSGDDIIVGYDSGEVGFYRNDGTWAYQKIGQVANSAVTDVIAIDTLNITGARGTPMSENVIAGFSSSAKSTYPIHIFSNTDLLGTPGMWTDTPYIGQVSNIRTTTASTALSSYSYPVHGTYLTSANGTGNYQAISEVNVSKTFYSRSTVQAVDSTSSIAVASGGSMSQATWNSWNITPTSQITSVQLEVSYYTSGVFDKNGPYPTFTYNVPSGAVQTAGSLGGWTNTITPNVVRFTLNGVDTDTKLFGLNVALSNAGTGQSVTFQYWRLYVTYTNFASVMDYTWTFTTPAGGTNSLDFDAAVSGIGDSFHLLYAVGTSNTYNSFAPSLVVSSVDYTKYSYNLPLTTAGTTFKIKVVDVNSLDDWSTNTTLSIRNLCINTTLLTDGSIGLPIKDLQVYDMDADGWQDLVIADAMNIWICYNNKAGSLTAQLPTQATDGTHQIPNIISIGVGKLSSPDKYPGIVVASGTGPYYIHTIKPVSARSYTGVVPQLKFTISTPVIKMVGGDVDGDGDLDIILANTNNQMWYYRNDGSGSFSPWLIDTLPSPINDIAAGKVQTN